MKVKSEYLTYQIMYNSPKFNSYLKLYSKTKAASEDRKKALSDDELCSSTELLIPPQDGFIDYIDKICMDHVLSPTFLHPGIELALKRHGQGNFHCRKNFVLKCFNHLCPSHYQMILPLAQLMPIFQKCL